MLLNAGDQPWSLLQIFSSENALMARPVFSVQGLSTYVEVYFTHTFHWSVADSLSYYHSLCYFYLLPDE